MNIKVDLVFDNCSVEYDIYADRDHPAIYANIYHGASTGALESYINRLSTMLAAVGGYFSAVDTLKANTDFFKKNKIISINLTPTFNSSFKDEINKHIEDNLRDTISEILINDIDGYKRFKREHYMAANTEHGNLFDALESKLSDEVKLLLELKDE